MSQEALPPSSMRLLRILRKEASDGYTLMGQLGTTSMKLFAEALAPLIRREFVTIAGDPHIPQGLATALYQVPLPHRGEVDKLLHDDLRKSLLKFPTPVR